MNACEFCVVRRMTGGQAKTHPNMAIKLENLYLEGHTLTLGKPWLTIS